MRPDAARRPVPPLAFTRTLRVAAKIRRLRGCWLWTGARNEQGYGLIFEARRKRMAHRVVYELALGPIPLEHELDHLCRRRCCVNPAHLEPVSHAVNIARSRSIPGLNARKTACKRGHPFTRENTYVRHRGERRERFCRACRRARCRRSL